MGDVYRRFRAAAVQAAPVFVDREATIADLDGRVANARNPEDSPKSATPRPWGEQSERHKTMLGSAPSPSRPARTPRFGCFELDLIAGCLRGRNGAEIALRPKSFDLLRYLACNLNRLVSRDELMAAVWPNVFVTDDSITQCVAEIRRALGGEGQALLRTVPKRGYILAAGPGRAEPPSPAIDPETRPPAMPSGGPGGETEPPRPAEGTDIAVWLRGLGLERYSAAFRENEIDAASLMRLTAQDLEGLGVTVIGHRHRLLDAIAALRNNGSQPTLGSANSPTAAAAGGGRLPAQSDWLQPHSDSEADWLGIGGVCRNGRNATSVE
ncbi:MAG: winged helix-turn-helix domain-containing protein [Acetobacteraceae bacterium]|nr:winged helix-turn-helix domain-containing protein [Acetobacteraceae bacterium]